MTEVRRFLPLSAAALFVAALAFPMWRITLTAPQYPGRELPVELYAYPRLGGEYEEVQLLNQYVGFYYPDPVFVDPNFAVHPNAIAVPEWTFGPVVFVLVAALSIFVALAPTDRKLRLGLTAQLLGTIGVFAGMLAIIQYRLHQAGHSLDPNAPLVGVDAFTPPLLGSYQIANISGTAWFGTGAYMTMGAIGLLVVAFLLRDSRVRLHEAPIATRAWLTDLANRVRSRRRDDAGPVEHPSGNPEVTSRGE